MPIAIGADTMSGPKILVYCDVCHVPIQTGIGHFRRGNGGVCVACHRADDPIFAADRPKFLTENREIMEPVSDDDDLVSLAIARRMC